MSAREKPVIQKTQIVYGEIIYWITILAAIICMIGPVISMVSVENNVMNPHFLFSAIFEGKNAETIWEEVGSGFPGGHFYLTHLNSGDGFTQFGLVLGCSSAFWGLLAVAFVYFRKKNYLYMGLALWVTALVCLSALGIVKGH